jgi:hypothetical protein
MGYHSYTVTHTAPEGLHQEVWHFCIIDLQIILDHYTALSRLTKRHTFRKGKVYSRLSPRDSTLSFDEVPFPQDVQDDVREQVIRDIVVLKTYVP